MRDIFFKQAKVINNNDLERKARIQVRVLPDLQDVRKEVLLPWVLPFNNSGMAQEQYSMDLPKVGSMVWVFFYHSEMYLDGFYINGSFIEGFFDFDSIAERINAITEIGSNVAYPNLRFRLSQSGNIYFENTENGECGIVKSNGAYALLNNEGFALDNGLGNIRMEANGNVIVNNNFKVEV